MPVLMSSTATVLASASRSHPYRPWATGRPSSARATIDDKVSSPRPGARSRARPISPDTPDTHLAGRGERRFLPKELCSGHRTDLSASQLNGPPWARTSSRPSQGACATGRDPPRAAVGCARWRCVCLPSRTSRLPEPSHERGLPPNCTRARAAGAHARACSATPRGREPRLPASLLSPHRVADSAFAPSCCPRAQGQGECASGGAAPEPSRVQARGRSRARRVGRIARGACRKVLVVSVCVLS